MDQRSSCKTQNFEMTKGRHTENTWKHRHRQCLSEQNSNCSWNKSRIDKHDWIKWEASAHQTKWLPE
jgi:hypothetical protein